jgi:hypothetical protein
MVTTSWFNEDIFTTHLGYISCSNNHKADNCVIHCGGNIATGMLNDIELETTPTPLYTKYTDSGQLQHTWNRNRHMADSD